MAVAGYVMGGGGQNVDYLMRATDPIDLERRRSLVDAATTARTKTMRGYGEAQRATSDELQRAVRTSDETTRAFEQIDAQVKATEAEIARLEAEVDNRRQLLDLVTAAAPVGSTDIPRLVLDAYRKAAAALSRRTPTCRVEWTALAAIGRIESNHGRYRGAQLALNGDVYPRIVGIPLDGTRSALIRDTDLGLLDGDLEFDRAVGPMQFIPSTWKRINEDGNGDDIRDPNNSYDAALGAAAYLCRANPAGNLDTDEGLRPAVFSYNHSDAYVEAVIAGKHAFELLQL
jgi:membrane-bound lytic murein transglycosylase B